MRMVELIHRKREGKELTKEEIQFWIDGYVKGEIPDYQSSAMTMAICFQGMTDEEMTNLTLSMMHSGDCVDLSGIEGIKVDKHSTGGVGDKTSLVIGPVVAACGVKLAKMSGRGLGHTGGTLDKMESVKGVSTDVSSEDFVRIVNEVGAAIIGQTGTLVPADKKLYALRDVTATVESLPLIASSIMSKKLASGSDCILLDVKTGSGAFMKSTEESIRLAERMVRIGTMAGKKTAALITQMDTPLGNYVGNIMEVFEAMDTLQGRGPEDFTYVCRHLAAQLIGLAGGGTPADNLRRVDDVLENGGAYKKFLQMLQAQGGDIEWLSEQKECAMQREDMVTGSGKACSKTKKCAYVYDVRTEREGYVCHTDTEAIGLSACVLGAGRETKEDRIDPYAGICIYKKYGDYVKAGDILATCYTNREAAVASAAEKILKAYDFSETKPEDKPLICGIVKEDGKTFPEQEENRG